MTKSLTHKGVSTRGSQRRESELAQEGVKSALDSTTIREKKGYGKTIFVIIEFFITTPIQRCQFNGAYMS